MRFVMMSVVIIIFAWSMQGVGLVSEDFNNSTGRYLYGAYATSQSNITQIASIRDREGMNNTMNELAETASNPPNQGIDTMWGYAANFAKAITTLYDLLIYPVLHVGSVIQYPMGTTSVKVIPDFWAGLITSGCYMCYLIGLVQLFGRFNLKGGA